MGALLAVLALVLAAARGARALGLGRPVPGQGGGARRLALLESLALDPRRRLLLVRCDDRELLILTGGAQEVVQPLPPVPPA
ncbi:hypothetical protein EXY23_24335 [Roseicella aquatilis]|uniref:Flagellar biosynthetic protein FliO n=2 Tax=Roseicella aquatilis TaxID=2527868 RepID=A0A4R4D413_9PROT|nr:hypothetical protein EXY23_24335 [Roseicella aquatilis]